MSFLDDLRDKRRKFLDGLEANQDDIKLDIFEDLYPDRAHFIFELLQNAEDACASEVSFVLSSKSLLFEHDGRSFDEEDIKAITGIGVGTKNDDDDKIGRFGIGFKAVFVYTKTPHVWSPTFAFKISDMVLPSKLSLNPSLGDRTRFEFPFDSPKKSARDAFSEIQTALEAISDDTLLFLSHIESIDWRIKGSVEGSLLRIPHPENRVEILREVGGKQAESSHFLRFIRPVEELKTQYTAIAFALEALSDASASDSTKLMTKRFRIIPAEPGRVAVFFTAEKESSGLRFHLHAPFVPEVSRASIKDTSANEPLFRQLAYLAADSLFEIRDLGFLNRDFLAVLPNKNDGISNRYKVIRKAIIDKMNEQPLTPTHAGSHAPAEQLLQAPADLKNFLDRKDIEILTEIEEGSLDWAIGATQRNNAVDRFLRGLAIREWGVEQFVRVLKKRLSAECRFDIESGKLTNDPDEELLAWLGSKPEEWHQRLYALLYQELEPAYKLAQLKNLYIVRLSAGDYRKGNECYFATDETQEDSIFPCVAKGTYGSRGNRAERERATKFLEAIGVREVGDREKVEKILNRRYSKEADIPNRKTYRNDLRRFISLVDSERNTAVLFRNYRIFERADGSWRQPSQVYLDMPYRDTGLHAFFEALIDDQNVVALSDSYLQDQISRKKLTAFAKAVGVWTNLVISKQPISEHARAQSLLQDSRAPWTKYHIDSDWTIRGLEKVLERPSEKLSRLIWKKMTKMNSCFLEAKFRPNKSYPTKTEPSSLILILRDMSWVPQKDGRFCRPAEAQRDLLPDGFPFDPGWPWLKAVYFGEENAKRGEERRREQEVAKKLGFNDNEALDHAQRFAELPPDLRRQILAKHEAPVDLPDHEPSDPERRAEIVLQGASKSPGRDTIIRPRSVSKHRDTVKEEAKPYLRQEYTNDDSVTICQVCKDALPFKLSDGNYFFEAVEFLPELEQHHYQNYLALCPNHAAMYRHANNTADKVKSLFLDLKGTELGVILAGEDKTVYFTKTHVADLRVIIETDDTEKLDA